MYEELAKNKRRTWVLMASFFAVVVGGAWAISWALGAGPILLIVAVIISIFLSWTSWYAGDKIVLKMSRAKLVEQSDQPRLHNIVEGLSISAGIPKPKVYVVEEAAPNAFATGRDPSHSSIAVTTGLLKKMNRLELEGVVAHELAHIKNRDTLVMAIVATLVGVLVLLADWTLRAFFWGFGGRRRDSGGSAGAVFVLVGIVAAILMPIFARIMRASVSRRREYYADMEGVRLTRYPPGLIGALEKLHEDKTVVRTAVRATGHLWIESPLEHGNNFMGKVNGLFDTHPPMEERIRLLSEL